MRASERTDERVAQYLRLGSWLIWSIVDGTFSLLFGDRAKMGVVAVGQNIFISFSSSSIFPFPRFPFVLFGKMGLGVEEAIGDPKLTVFPVSLMNIEVNHVVLRV